MLIRLCKGLVFTAVVLYAAFAGAMYGYFDGLPPELVQQLQLENADREQQSKKYALSKDPADLPMGDSAALMAIETHRKKLGQFDQMKPLIFSAVSVGIAVALCLSLNALCAQLVLWGPKHK